MKCINCGKARMVQETRELVYIYKGQKTTIPNVSGQFCSVCNESVHDEEESEYLNAAMLSFAKKVNAATVKPDFISDTRKRLKLDQREASELFGGGANAFSRYETGKTRPPIALVQLFKLLANHPELIDELRPKKSKLTPAQAPRAQLKRRSKMIPR